MNEILEEILGKLKTGLGTKITSYYQGEVVLVPQSYLPALMIFNRSTRVIAKSTAKDQYEYEIVVRVVFDVKKFMNEAGVTETLKAPEAMGDIMEERNTNQTLKNDTVLGILRDNVRGEHYLFNNDIRIEYKTLQRGEWFYFEAECVFNAVTNLILR